MARAAYVQSSFLGGEWSKSAQGGTHRPEYRSALNVCLNTIPIESASALRRPGTAHCAVMRNGLNGRVLPFDFEQPFPSEMLITSDGVMRFLSETALATTNDDATITAISAANPAVVTTAAAHGWTTANQTRATSNVTQLMNRDLAITVLSPTTFSIADAITGTGINGAALDAFTAGTIARIAELVTPFAGNLWQNLRSIQAETTAVMVNGDTRPQVLSVTQEPGATAFAEFALTAADFLDGPYLDPIPGSWITSNALNGVVNLTLSFQAYDPTVAYSIGDYVTYSGQGYRSLSSASVNKQPDAWPALWKPVNAGDPLNDGAGFIGADVGRLVRLFSEPPLWAASSSYTTGQIVAYAASGEAQGYYQATGAIGAGVKPGTSTLWSVVSGASVAIWTWGQILSVSGSGIVAPIGHIGDMTGGGGLAAAFDGNTTKSFTASANVQQATATYQPWSSFPWPLGTTVQYNGRIYRLDFLVTGGFVINFAIPPAGYPFWTDMGPASNIALDRYVGGHMAAPVAISSVTITPTTDVGFTNSPQNAIGFNLRAKASAPASASDGTLLGTTGIIANTTAPVSIVSGDQTTTWNYVWVEPLANYNQPLPDSGSHSFTANLGIAQVQFFSPNIANGSVVSVQIRGDALLYANPCRKWRFGTYGGTNGYPKNGTYTDGRIWLSGVIGNRIDSSKSNVIRNGELVLNMAPTAPDGTAADDNAITAVFTGPDVNQIFWMEPDQQGIICGTQAGEWLVFAPAQGGLSPLNIDARRVTKIGCANILPHRTDHTLVFVQKFLREIQEYFADVFSGKFSSPHLTKDAKHMTVPNVLELAFQQQKASVIWGRLANGLLMGITYQRDSLTTSRGPDFAAAHRHTLGSARAIRSICTGGSAGGNLDSLYMVTEDSGGGVFHAEVLTDLLDEGFNFSDVWLLDNGIVPQSFAIDTTVIAGAPYGGVHLYGLWPHNGKTVSAYLVGIDCASRGLVDGAFIVTEFTVSNGSIFVPFGDGVSRGCGDGLFTQALVTPYVGGTLPGVVGFRYDSDGQIVRPATPQESGAKLGPALGDERRTHKYAAQLYGCVTQSISFGVDFDHLEPAILKDADRTTELARNVLFSGIHKDNLTADSDMDNMLCWRVSGPHPAFVIALAGKLQTVDE